MKPRWTILVAEDDDNDVLILEHAFSKVRTDIGLRIVNDGQDAIDYLSGANGFNDRSRFPFPDVLLLDLKMPRVDGFNVLEWLQQHPPLSRLRVIVFSSSSHHADVDRAYDLGASSFFRKPPGLDEMVSIVDGVKCWLDLNQFPVLADMIFPPNRSGN